jgi:hypothetical protein
MHKINKKPALAPSTGFYSPVGPLKQKDIQKIVKYTLKK